VEMLEQQQSQLVSGLQETYRRLVVAQVWPGSRLLEHNGNPLTHDILARLELLEPKLDGSGEMEVFEEDCQKLQSRLVSDGAPFLGRRGSFSSESDHESNHKYARTSSKSSVHDSPPPQAQPVFENPWNFQASPSPIILSPPPKMKKAQLHAKPSPLSSEPVRHNDFIAPSWEALVPAYMRSDFSLQTPMTHDNMHTLMETYAQSMDPATLDSEISPLNFDNQGFVQRQTFNMYNSQDWLNEPPTTMDLDEYGNFNNFVQVPA